MGRMGTAACPVPLLTLYNTHTNRKRKLDNPDIYGDNPADFPPNPRLHFQAGRQARCSAYSLGESPVCFLNVEEKYVTSL